MILKKTYSILIMLLSIIILISSLNIVGVASGDTKVAKQVKANNQAEIDYTYANKGYVNITWKNKLSTRIKVIVNDPKDVQYIYEIFEADKPTTLPLSSGDGSYKITVYKNISGTKYSTVISQNISVKLIDQFAPFIIPNQFVDYKSDSETVKKATELCKDCTKNLDKVSAVYNYVINNLTYDKEKAKTVASNYLPVVDSVLAEKKGICFDYASLMTAMLRSQGIPTKLVVGYAGTSYHAWISVYSEAEGWINNIILFNGKEWKLMDPTFASSGKQNSSIMKYIGDGKNYTEKFIY